MADIKVLAGGQPEVPGGIVSADQTTVFGDGTALNPLHTSGSKTYIPPTPGFGTAVVPGTAVAFTTSGSLALVKALATTAGQPNVIGLSTQSGNTGSADGLKIQSSGDLVLPTAEWDAVTGQSGGLTPGAAYYLSSVTSGHLTTTQPSATNTYVTQIGIAQNATTMLIRVGPAIGPHA